MSDELGKAKLDEVARVAGVSLAAASRVPASGRAYALEFSACPGCVQAMRSQHEQPRHDRDEIQSAVAVRNTRAS